MERIPIRDNKGGKGARMRRDRRNTAEFLEKKRLDPTWTRSGETQV